MNHRDAGFVKVALGRYSDRDCSGTSTEDPMQNYVLAGWFQRLFQTGSSSQSANRCRLLAEPLERRVLLSTVLWTGEAGDGDFSNPDNWMGGNAPGVDDIAVINAGSV